MHIGTLNVYELSIYIILWSSLYFFFCYYNPSRSKEWHCRTVSTLHALVVSALAIYGTFYLGPWPWSDAGGPNTQFQIHTCCLCLAYFLFDLSWCLYYQTEGAVMLAHHLLSILGLSWSLLGGVYGTEMLATIGGAELTNPLLQLRWFMKELGHYDTIWGDVIDLAFMFAFAFMRIYLGTILLYMYYLQPTDFVGRLGGTLIYIIGWIFFISIVNFAIHKYTKRFKAWRKRRSSKGANSGNSPEQKDDSRNVSIIRDKEIPSQREIKHRDGELALRKNCVVKESL